MWIFPAIYFYKPPYQAVTTRLPTRTYLRRLHGKFTLPTTILIFAVSLTGCQPPRSDEAAMNKNQSHGVSPEIAEREGMRLIPGGTVRVGSRDGMPHEAPVHEVEIKPFWIDETEVTVGDFARFVEATGYVTDAEKFNAGGVFDIARGEWTVRPGATWRTPDGADGNVTRADEPVCQVSWRDAATYANWRGKRLPTEAEWERAARGGLLDKTYSWGNDLMPNGKPPANWWQGEFPRLNTKQDGYLTRAPVKSYAPNGYGLYDTAGNVWEWCADWYAADYYAQSPRLNPQGAATGTERVMRGGSFLCAENFCTNYRVAGRSSATPDTSLNNVGFRCAKDAE